MSHLGYKSCEQCWPGACYSWGYTIRAQAQLLCTPPSSIENVATQRTIHRPRPLIQRSSVGLLCASGGQTEV